MQYSHYVIAHGKALAECLSQRRPLSDSKYRNTFLEYDYIKNKPVFSNATCGSSVHHAEQPPVGLQGLPTTKI